MLAEGERRRDAHVVEDGELAFDARRDGRVAAPALAEAAVGFELELLVTLAADLGALGEAEQMLAIDLSERAPWQTDRPTDHTGLPTRPQNRPQLQIIRRKVCPDVLAE